MESHNRKERKREMKKEILVMVMLVVCSFTKIVNLARTTDGDICIAVD